MAKLNAFPIKKLPREFEPLKRLRAPAQVQDFLNTLKFNFEDHGNEYRSPFFSLRSGRAHCFEAALIAAAAFWYHGRPPLILQLTSTDNDVDHVVALYKEGNRWGAVSKTNHAVLRYRDAVYRDVRELAMSYFHEYFLDTGRKTLRTYSARPFDLSKIKINWLTTEYDLGDLVEAVDLAKHMNMFSKDAERRLRNADPIEIKAGQIVNESPKK